MLLEKNLLVKLMRKLLLGCLKKKVVMDMKKK